jgi:hypothetical protein
VRRAWAWQEESLAAVREDYEAAVLRWLQVRGLRVYSDDVLASLRGSGLAPTACVSHTTRSLRVVSKTAPGRREESMSRLSC